MKKSDILIALTAFTLVTFLQIHETKHWQDPHNYYIYDSTPAVNLDRERELYWYFAKDEEGRKCQILSEDIARKYTFVTARKKSSGYIPGEVVFDKKSN